MVAPNWRPLTEPSVYRIIGHMNELLTTKEVALRLGLAPDSIGVFIRQGTLAASKIGRDWLVAADEVERYRCDHLGQRNKAEKRPVPDCADDAVIEVPMSNGTVALISGADRDLYAHRWCASNGYASRQLRKEHRTEYMHRVVLSRMLGRPLAPGELPDHINRIKTDNRRSNLRLANQAQNQRNQDVDRASRTGYKGVQYKSDLGRYRARIGDQHLGYFDNAVDAARAYNQAATELYGEFAKLNDVSE